MTSTLSSLTDAVDEWTSISRWAINCSKAVGAILFTMSFPSWWSTAPTDAAGRISVAVSLISPRGSFGGGAEDHPFRLSRLFRPRNEHVEAQVDAAAAHPRRLTGSGLALSGLALSSLALDGTAFYGTASNGSGFSSIVR